jgi:DNA polymerase-3 subunit gamma/tau
MSLFDDPPDPGLGLPGLDPPVAAPPSAPPVVAYRVLARKYRPTTFDDLIGQDVLVRILRNAFRRDRVAHAFMLTGVRGVGKTTTARIIARCLNCIGPDGQGGPTADPCGVCPNCVAILADRHPDVSEMDAASRTGVDDVREIIEATRFRPLQARTRVFIIDEVHMLSRNAFNALLKTLEEPPPHVKFVFATTDIRKVPVTVLSRCQRFDLRRVSVAELATHFARVATREEVAIEDEALALIARAAEGSVRDGLSLLDQVIAQAAPGEPIRAAAVSEMLGVSDRDSLFDLTEALMAGRVADMLAVTDRAHERGADLGVMLADLLDLLHILSRLKAIPELRTGRDLSEIERTRGAALADRLDMAIIGRAWQMLLKGVQEVEAAPDRRAAAEMILIRLCHVADLPAPADLVRQLSGAAPRSDAPGTAPSPRPAGGQGPHGGGQGGSRAVGGGAGAIIAMPERAPPAMASPPPRAVAAAPTPRLDGLADIAALAAERREASLHAHLRQSVHLVRFAPPVIELRPRPEAPRDLAARLAALLLAATGTRWTIALSAAPGEPTLAELDVAESARQRADAARHPLVQAILEAFPGARIETAEPDSPHATAPPPPREPAPNDATPDEGPGFAPDDAEPAELPIDEEN